MRSPRVIIPILGSAARPLPARIAVAVVVVATSIAWFTQAGEFSIGVHRTPMFQALLTHPWAP